MYGKTSKFFLMKYMHGDGRLHIGDRVKVHPHIDEFGSITSQSGFSFISTIIQKDIKWCDGEMVEICTDVKGGYSAVMNDYLFSRLEKI